MRVGELAERLHVRYRDVRYILEQGGLPLGIEEKPGRGEFRDLNPGQSFWLAIVLNLKQIGIRVPIAKQVADFAREAVRTVTQNYNWERSFEPFLGKLETENQWYVDIGDLKFIRLVTSACPSIEGLCELPWSIVGQRKTVQDVVPVISVRVDLTRLASLMAA
jgi:hypothetical protein